MRSRAGAVLLSLVPALAAAQGDRGAPLPEPALVLVGDRFEFRPLSGLNLGDGERSATALGIRLHDMAMLPDGARDGESRAQFEAILEGLRAQENDWSVLLAARLEEMAAQPVDERRGTLEDLLSVQAEVFRGDGGLSDLVRALTHGERRLLSLRTIEETLGEPPYPKGFGDVWGIGLYGLDRGTLEKLLQAWRPPAWFEPPLHDAQSILNDRCLQASVTVGPQGAAISNATGKDQGGFAVEVSWDGLMNKGGAVAAGSPLPPDEYELLRGTRFGWSHAASFSAVCHGPFCTSPGRFSHVEPGRLPNTTTSFCIIARRGGVDVESRRVSATTADVPAPGVSVTATVAGPRSIAVSWSAGNYPVTGYRVTRRTAPLADALLYEGTATSFGDDPRWRPGTYEYDVEATFAWKTPTGGDVKSTGTGSASIPRPPMVTGYADLHTHQMANLAHGGLLIHGFSADGGGDISTSLTTCDGVHGWNGTGDLVTAALNETLPGHGTQGFPAFSGWPRSDSKTHQQMYRTWLKRAWRGGLRLMVMLAGNDEVLCNLVGTAPGRTCDDMEAIQLQVNFARGFEAEIAASDGGWYRIVTTPEQARAVINAGNLAVVLGAEVDTLFGCGTGTTGDLGTRPTCTVDDVKTGLDGLRNLGITHVFPIHIYDNGFGGGAAYQDVMNLSHKFINGYYQNVQDCSAAGVTFRYGLPSSTGLGFFDSILGSYLPPAYPPAPAGHCNSRGLTGLGQIAVTEMMKRNMIIDIDHMSGPATDAVFTLAQQTGYPLVAGHSGPISVARPFLLSGGSDSSRTERLLSDSELTTVVRSGGLAGIGISGGGRDRVLQYVRPDGTMPVIHDCGNSSRTFAQFYLRAVDVARAAPANPDVPPVVSVAFGSDFNSMLTPPQPRFSTPWWNSCGGDLDAIQDVNVGVLYDAGPNGTTVPKGTGGIDTSRWPFSFPGVLLGRSRVDEKNSSPLEDYNVTGLHHIGLYPDFIEDLRAVGVSNADLEPLFRSAEGYIQMWERTRWTAPQ